MVDEANKGMDFAGSLKSRARKFVLQVVENDYLKRVNECYDLDNMRWLSAAMSSSDYMMQHMRTAMRFADWNSHYQYISSLIPSELKADGLFMEFGVYSGSTINIISELTPEKTIYGFDSFEGLPDGWFAGIKKGIFSTDGVGPQVNANVELVVGWFDETLPGFLNGHKDKPAAFIHMDCDIYSSTVTCLNALRSRIVPGTVILFDEYFNYPEWQFHEHKALQEFCAAWNVKYKYVSLMPSYMKVAIQIVSRD